MFVIPKTSMLHLKFEPLPMLHLPILLFLLLGNSDSLLFFKQNNNHIAIFRILTLATKIDARISFTLGNIYSAAKGILNKILIKIIGKREKERTEETEYSICQIHNFDDNLNLSLIATSGFSKFQAHMQ